jgi:hypothetical protein
MTFFGSEKCTVLTQIKYWIVVEWAYSQPLQAKD